MYGVNPFEMDGGGDIADVAIQESLPDIKILSGDGNSPPVQSDDSGQIASTALQKLGSIGDTARDLGTAIGTFRRNISGAGAQYRAAQDAAYNGNSLSTWWQYASTTDKLMVGLAVVAILVSLKD